MQTPQVNDMRRPFGSHPVRSRDGTCQTQGMLDFVGIFEAPRERRKKIFATEEESPAERRNAQMSQGG